jgi:hypothetical protein
MNVTKVLMSYTACNEVHVDKSETEVDVEQVDDETP